MGLHELVTAAFRLFSRPVFMLGGIGAYAITSLLLLSRGPPPWQSFLPPKQSITSPSRIDVEAPQIIDNTGPEILVKYKAPSQNVDPKLDENPEVVIELEIPQSPSATGNDTNRMDSGWRGNNPDTTLSDSVNETGVNQRNTRDGGAHQQKPRMNYFVAFRVTDPVVLQTIGNVQEQMMSSSGRVLRRKKLEVFPGKIFRESLIPASKLHFTLHVMSLQNEEEREKAKTAVGRVWDLYKDDFKMRPVTAHIQGVDHFHNSILFAKMYGEDAIERLTVLANQFRQEFEALNIPGETRPFAAHMTIAKISKSRKLRDMGIRSFPVELWKDSIPVDFGSQKVEQIQLLSMLGSDPGGYYPSIADFKID